MNVEFHYYIIHYLARQAGFASHDSWIIAYSSQFVDNSLYRYTIDTRSAHYQSVISQNYGFWNRSFSQEVYIPFHFFPSGMQEPHELRKDRGKNPFSVRPNSGPVKELLREAFKSKNLYRIGIALHTFADSYAHQNFSGLKEEWNRVDTDNLIPPVGHVQVLNTPDYLEKKWHDPRLREEFTEIYNRDRFTEAAKKIYRYLCTYRRRNFDDEELVLDLLDEHLGKRESEKISKDRILSLIVEEDIEEYNRNEWKRTAFYQERSDYSEKNAGGYDKLIWLNDAMRLGRKAYPNARLRRAREGFDNSHFYHWNEAAKIHKKTAAEILKQI